MLKDLITRRKARVGIIGMGYVGLPLALQVLEKGFSVVGVDIDRDRVARINKGFSFIDDVETSKVEKFVTKGTFRATVNYASLGKCDIIIICVPTPVNENKEPDMRPIIESSIGIRRILRKEQLVILKSTTYPETTEKVVLPILQETGLKPGKDFYLAFCPERIDPGNKKFGVANTPTVIGGVTRKCTEMACLFYRQFIKQVYPVSSARTAEMTKLLENTFRNVNIALVNEFAQLCERMGGINIWEVVDAAKTKPFGYMPFYPGPGVGGHCIPIDPYYLSWKAREYDFHTVFIELSARINEEMPFFVVNKTIDALSHSGVCPAKARILILGMAFKKDISDLRHSPAIRIYQIIKPKVKQVVYNDPFVPYFLTGDRKVYSVSITKSEIRKSDIVLLLTDHSQYDYKFIVDNAKVVIDTRNAIKFTSKKVKKLGSGL